MADPSQEHRAEDTAKGGITEAKATTPSEPTVKAAPANEPPQSDVKGTGPPAAGTTNSIGEDARAVEGTTGGPAEAPAPAPRPVDVPSAGRPTVPVDARPRALSQPSAPEPRTPQPSTAQPGASSVSGSSTGCDSKVASKRGSRAFGNIADQRTAQMPSGSPKDMYDSLLSDSNKRDVSKAKHTVMDLSSRDSADSPFRNLDELKEFMYSYYTEGQSIIAQMRDRMPRDIPEELSFHLENFFKRYIMIKWELDCYFSTMVKYDSDKLEKAERRFWPNRILKNTDENISWIMEQIRGRTTLAEFYNNSLEQLKLLLYQMREATVMYDWHHI